MNPPSLDDPDRAAGPALDRPLLSLAVSPPLRACARSRRRTHRKGTGENALLGLPRGSALAIERAMYHDCRAAARRLLVPA